MCGKEGKMAVYYITNEKEQMVKKPLTMESGAGGEMSLIKLYPEETRQKILGFGGAFTEASAYTVSTMDEETRKQTAELYFGTTGNRYNFCRTHIQSCDFALGNYAYIEDSNDKELKTFTLERDQKYIIPWIRMAFEHCPDLELLASPWSPPAFMKSNGEMNHGGVLKKEYYPMWADMIAKYVAEYEKLGIRISRLTVQNEPQAVQSWDSCIYTGTEEGEFAVNYLRPALDRKGYKDVTIAVWDHNKEIFLERAAETFAVKGADASIGALAFHWYSGDHFESLQMVREKYPEKELIFTEGCVEYSRFEKDNQVRHAEIYAHDMIGNFNHGMNGFIDWNLVLDAKGGPNHVGNYCDAPIMYEEEKKYLDVKLSYYYIGHFSRFVRPGAKAAVVTRFTDKLECAGFINPDGSQVVVILNRTEDTIEFTLQMGMEKAGLKMDAHSILTVVK